MSHLAAPVRLNRQMGFFSTVRPWKSMRKNCVGSWLIRCSGENSVTFAPLFAGETQPPTRLSAPCFQVGMNAYLQRLSCSQHRQKHQSCRNKEVLVHNSSNVSHARQLSTTPQLAHTWRWH